MTSDLWHLTVLICNDGGVGLLFLSLALGKFARQGKE
jgi:hypothetical protein